MNMEAYSEHVTVGNAYYTLDLAVIPGTDLDSRFKALDLDTLEFIFVNGWLFN